MNRHTALDTIESHDGPWDVIIIGGGATGLGAAIDAASRGYDALILEQSDFAKATSGRSTKLVHGGVRYLQQGNVSLVLEALKERGFLFKNAPHLVRNLSFVVPNYDWWEGPFYGIGLKLYDMLAGKQGFGRSRLLSRQATLEQLPTIEPAGLRGGVIYYDGQFDDARLAINMAQTVVDQGGTPINYMRVTGLTKRNGVVDGVIARDLEGDTEHELKAKAVVNATGIFTDSIRRLDEPGVRPMIRPSQGVHIVLERSFLPGNSAVMVPKTDDGRVLFAIPWRDRIVVGTTDTPLESVELEPRPLQEEVDFLLEHAARYLAKVPSSQDVRSMFAGIRPLVSLGDKGNTSQVSRDHTLYISPSGLVTITGGKWTTYRKMAEDTIDHVSTLAQLEERPSVTKDLPIHGWHRNADQFGALDTYGADAPSIQELTRRRPELDQPIHDRLPYRAVEVVWAVRQEMARTLDDVLARRTRSLILDAAASLDAAPQVARLMAAELGRDDDWATRQVDAYRDIAAGYLTQS
ncbi:MAG: glycerol-3-phosphate dehydrogenase/oxidase [Planctomycetota bacterium]